jgi:hypothetical protein
MGSWRARQVHGATLDEEADEDRRLVESHRSPGLKEVFASAPRRKDLRILDLGPSVAGNFEFYTDFASGVRFVGLFDHNRHVDVAHAMGHKARVHDLEELTAEHAGTFDIALAWDIFNYLPEDQARKVVQALAGLCRPGARLLTIIVEADTMPAWPSTFKIINEESLAYQLESTDVRGGPQLPPAGVERLLAGFAVEHTYVLRHGVREYVAVRKEEGI